MGFLIKVAFWLGLALFLIPRDDTEKQELYSAAGRTVRNVGGFCDRNGELCSTGRTALGFIVAQVRRGAEAAEAALTEPGNGTTRVVRANVEADAAEPDATSITGTLTAADMQPGWHLGVRPTAKAARAP